MGTQVMVMTHTRRMKELAGAKVLVVDDSPSVLAFAASTLQQAGCEVLTSGDIWIASAITEFNPDLVLIDVNLAGGCTGPTVIRALKKRALSRTVRYVLYSTEPSEQLEQLAASCEADGSLHKDGNPVALVSEVARVLESSH